MKERIKDVYVTLLIAVMVLLPVVHLSFVIKVAKEQGEVRKLKRSLKEYEDQYQTKKIAFENKVDLQKIEKEARTKLGMDISNEIEYFKLK